MNSKPRVTVSVVITNYNTWHLTTRCLEALRTFSGAGLAEVIVVDDFSSQPSPHVDEFVKILRNPANRGYAASVNVGLSAAKGDVVVLLDSDACPLTDVAIPAARAFAAEPQLGALGFRTVDEKGAPTGSSELEPDALGLLLGQRMAQLRERLWLGRKRRRLVLYSCAIALRREAFLAVGGFDETFDFLDADIDFSLRLHEAGWLQRIDDRLLATHTGGGSPQATSKRVVRFHRNRWRCLEKHGRLRAPALLRLGLAVRHAAEYVGLRLIGPAFMEKDELTDKLDGRRALLRSVWSGYVEFQG